MPTSLLEVTQYDWTTLPNTLRHGPICEEHHPVRDTVRRDRLRAPFHFQRDRVERCERTCTGLHQRMTDLVASPEGPQICAAFARRYPAVSITDMKRVDHVHWRIRA